MCNFLCHKYVQVNIKTIYSSSKVAFDLANNDNDNNIYTRKMQKKAFCFLKFKK